MYKRQVKEAIARVEDKINGEIDKFDQKINGEIDKVLGEVKSNITYVQALKAKAERYLFYAKIIFAIMTSSILIMLFLVWRAFRKISGLYKLLDNVRSYKEIEKRVAALEGKVK